MLRRTWLSSSTRSAPDLRGRPHTCAHRRPLPRRWHAACCWSPPQHSVSGHADECRNSRATGKPESLPEAQRRVRGTGSRFIRGRRTRRAACPWGCHPRCAVRLWHSATSPAPACRIRSSAALRALPALRVAKQQLVERVCEVGLVVTPRRARGHCAQCSPETCRSRCCTASSAALALAPARSCAVRRHGVSHHRAHQQVILGVHHRHGGRGQALRGAPAS